MPVMSVRGSRPSSITRIAEEGRHSSNSSEPRSPPSSHREKDYQQARIGSGVASPRHSISPIKRPSTVVISSFPSTASLPTDGVAAKLLRPFAAAGHRIADVLVLQLLEPDDDMRTAMRKGVTAVLLCLVPFLLGMTIFLMVEKYTGNDCSDSVFLWLATSAVTIPCFLAPWITTRCSKKLRKQLLDLGIFALNAGIITTNCASTQLPTTTTAVLGWFLASLASTALLPLHYLMGAFAFFQYIYNDSYGSSGGASRSNCSSGRSTATVAHTVLAIANRRDASPGEHLALSFFGLVTAAILGLSAWYLLRTVVKQNAATKAAVDLTRTAAKKLNRYDTDGVRRVLATAAALGTCDGELIGSFQLLVEQLERYRPHIPNWVLMQDEREADVVEVLAHPTESEGDVKSSMSHSVDEPPNREAAPGAGNGRHSPVPDQNDGARLSNSSSLSSILDYPGGIDRVPVSTLQTARISFARLQFLVDRTQRGAHATLAGLVDAVYERALACQGAVHSFIGDTVQVSWNAVTHVFHGELKATRFAARMASFGRATDIWIGGSVFTGPATVATLGSKQAALTLSMPKFEAASNYATAFGFKHRTIIACSNTMSVARYEIDAYPVDAVIHGPRTSLPPTDSPVDDAVNPQSAISALANPTPSSWVLYAVANEKSTSDNGEWMYILDRHDALPSAAVASAMDACLAADYTKAHQILLALPPGYVQTQPLIQRFRAKVEACLANPRKEFHELV